jgi:hypothetical protein
LIFIQIDPVIICSMNVRFSLHLSFFIIPLLLSLFFLLLYLFFFFFSFLFCLLSPFFSLSLCITHPLHTHIEEEQISPQIISTRTSRNLILH